MRKILFLIFVIFTANICFAQEKQYALSIPSVSSFACEGNPAAVSLVMKETQQENERLFVIFRAAKTETESVNRKRLAYMKENMLERYAAHYKLKLIYALGKKSSDEGKIEFYVGSRLSLIMIAPRNRTPCLDCCGDESYYPQNLVKKKKSLKRKHK